MKKKFYILILFIISVNIFACAGYKPIFTSSNFNFKITDYKIIGDKKLGNQIYSKLYILTRSAENNAATKNFYVSIDVSKNKTPTAKNISGHATAYKISMSTRVIIKDFITEKKILNQNFMFSSSYKTQEQYSETLRSESKSTENLINETYEAILLKLSETIL